MERKGQLAIPLHWIYILIAGAVILVFFIVIVSKQKTISQDSLSITVIGKLEGIFTGASLSEQTVNIIDIPNLQLKFVCDETGYSEFKVGDVSSEITNQPFFAPSTLETSQLVTWALEFNMPIKVTNLLYIGSTSINYLVVYDPANPTLMNQIQNTIPEQFNFNYIPISSLETFTSKTQYTKLIYTTRPSATLPLSIRRLPDSHVTAVEIGPEAATFYSKQGATLVYDDAVAIIPTLNEKNPTWIAAIFSDSSVAYRCNMGKAFKRLSLLSPIYQQRTQRITDSYTPPDRCSLLAESQLFEELRIKAAGCIPYKDECTQISSLALEINNQNTNMQNSNCPAIY
jgi:hypothetical protein